MRLGLIVMAIGLLLNTAGLSTEDRNRTEVHPDPRTVPCWRVMMYVWEYGEDVAVTVARMRGYTEDQIAQIRKRCKRD